MGGLIKTFLAFALVAATASISTAKLCGDDVSGERVPCDCGDVVASDTTLRAGDPIIARRCPSIGLIVRASPVAETLTLNLAGLTLRGSGRGSGLFIDGGGADGASIVGAGAEIVAFDTGVSVPNPTALKRLERLTSRANRSDGFFLRHSGAYVIDAAAIDNGGEGFFVVGRGGRFLRLRAERNARNGIEIQSPGAEVSGQTQDNGNNGIVSQGPRTDLNGIVARNNGRYGVVLRTPRQATDATVAYGNGRAQVNAAGVIKR